MSSKRAVCLRCKRDKRIQGRGLCQPCYKREETDGRIGQYPTRFEKNNARNARIVAMLRAGATTMQVAEATNSTTDVVRGIARREGLAGTRADAYAPQWVLAQIEPAPDVVPCVGYPMDTDGLTPKELLALVKDTDALALCASCPLATREWCLRTVDPRGIGKEWQGVAGGAVWSHGRLVYMPADLMEEAS